LDYVVWVHEEAGKSARKKNQPHVSIYSPEDFSKTSELNEVAEGDLGGETCKVSKPLNFLLVSP
jgi:hypothetical protein